MATHSSILVWEIPWTEEPGGYPATPHRGGHQSQNQPLKIPQECQCPSIVCERLAIFQCPSQEQKLSVLMTSQAKSWCRVFMLIFSDCEDKPYPKSKSLSRLNSLIYLTTCISSVNCLFNPLAHFSTRCFIIYYFAEVFCVLGTHSSCKRALMPLYPGLHSVELSFFFSL